MILKIEDVKAGDKLECIDHDGYLDSVNENALDLTSIVIREVDHNLSLFLTEGKGQGKSIKFSDIKYFKKKEQSQQYTFDDLIDGARKAFKDVKIFSFGVTDCAVGIKLLDKSEKIFTLMDICNGVEFIQSLYKETFVIETEEDLKRVKLNPKITLNNGEVIPFSFKSAVKDHLIFYDQPCGHNMIHFVFLKGATVEQEWSQ